MDDDLRIGGIRSTAEAALRLTAAPVFAERHATGNAIAQDNVVSSLRAGTVPAAASFAAPASAGTSPAPTVWVLKCHRAGDHAQSLALANELGWPYVVKDMEFHWYELFFALADKVTLTGFDRRRSSPLTPPWPDLVIMAGRRNEIPARWIRAQSGGRTKVVVIGRYWTPPEDLDLVVTTPQFRLPTHHGNVLLNDFPLHLASKQRLDEAGRAWAPRIAGLPGPYVTLLVGGSTGPYVFSKRTAQRLGREASAFARALGASLLVTTSARTGRAAMQALRAAIDVPCHFYQWRPRDPDNPYLGFLGLADAVIATADSMSMIAEACMTDRPVYLFEFGNGPAAMHGPRARNPENRQWWRWSQLRDQGVLGLPYAWWIGRPPRRLNRSRDIRLVLDRFIASGRAQWLSEELLADPARLRQNAATTHAKPLEDVELAAQAVRRLLGLAA